MKELKNSGVGYSKIAQRFGVSISTVRYHLEEEYNNSQKSRARIFSKNLSKEQRQEYQQNRYPNQKDYQKNRYHTDEEYRKRVIGYSVKYQKKIK